jgi:hypothetical protein
LSQNPIEGKVENFYDTRVEWPNITLATAENEWIQDSVILTIIGKVTAAKDK